MFNLPNDTSNFDTLIPNGKVLSVTNQGNPCLCDIDLLYHPEVSNENVQRLKVAYQLSSSSLSKAKKLYNVLDKYFNCDIDLTQCWSSLIINQEAFPENAEDISMECAKISYVDNDGADLDT